MPRARRSHLENYTPRQLECLELRLKGLSFREIAKEMGISVNRAYKLASTALAKYAEDAQETVAQVSQISLERLDELLIPFLAKAKAGDEKALDSVIKIMDRQARLLGLDKQADKTIKVQWESLIAEAME